VFGVRIGVNFDIAIFLVMFSLDFPALGPFPTKVRWIKVKEEYQQ
jgi:hypothetical protein